MFWSLKGPCLSLSEVLGEFSINKEELLGMMLANGSVTVFVFPSETVCFDLRLKEEYKGRCISIGQEDPLRLDLSGYNAFSLCPVDAEGVISTGWLYAKKPLGVACFDPYNNVVSIDCPVSAARENSGDISSWSVYHKNEFVFSDEGISQRGLALGPERVFFLKRDVDALEAPRECFFPKIDSVPDYEAGPWSNQLLIDLNIAFKHFHRGGVIREVEDKLGEGSGKDVVTKWFEKRWEKLFDGKVSRRSVEVAHEIIDPEKSNLWNLQFLNVGEEDVFRNQEGATSLMIMLDVAAKRRNDGCREYTREKSLVPELAKTGPISQRMGHAIYGIVKWTNILHR